VKTRDNSLILGNPRVSLAKRTREGGIGSAQPSDLKSTTEIRTGQANARTRGER
jgi:hypothetical protein